MREYTKHVSTIDRIVLLISWFIGSIIMSYISIRLNNAWWIIALTAVYYGLFVVSLVLFVSGLVNKRSSNE